MIFVDCLNMDITDKNSVPLKDVPCSHARDSLGALLRRQTYTVDPFTDPFEHVNVHELTQPLMRVAMYTDNIGPKASRKSLGCGLSLDNSRLILIPPGW